MALQTIFLGTPNNNDGDSLYAGGTKINSNFTELYTQLAGSPTGALRIDLGTPLLGAPVTGDVLGWSPINNQFIPSSSTMLKTVSGNGSSVLILTNNTGKAGPDEEYTSIPNALEMILNGRRMWGLVATTTGSTAATRGTWYIGMGNPQATSLAISARGVAVAGVDSLTVYRQAAEENSVSSLMLSTGSSGIILHRTPIINSDFYKDPSDSSGAVIHSGFVQQAISQRGFANGTSVVVGARGVAGGGSLAEDRQLVTDMTFFNDHITGLSYNFRGSPARIIISPGSAAHYSFSVSSATTISSTEVRAFAASTAEMNRAWNNDAAWNDSNTQACLDTIVANTWYYLYLIANNNNGNTDFVVTDSRTYSVVESKLGAASGGAAYSVIRRIGAFRTNPASIDPLPFVTHSRGRDIKFDFAFHGTGPQHGIIDYATTISSAPVTTAAITIGLLTTSVATTASIALYSSVLIRGIPPLPGVTADLNIIHFTTRVFNAVAFCGEPWASSAATVYGATGTGAPTEIVKEVVASVTSISRRTISISPTGELITDSVHAGSTVWNASSGTNIRYAIVNQSTAAQALTETAPPTLLGWDVRGFTIER